MIVEYEYKCCKICRHCRYDEELDMYFCRRSYTQLLSPWETKCDDYESDDY